jgi:hypothetical protein
VNFYDNSTNWLDHPFDWWVKNEEPALAIFPLTEKSGINLMAALHDIYVSIFEHDNKKALMDAEILASSIIAKSIGEVDILLEKVAEASVSNINFDDELMKMIEEDSNGS